MIEGYCCHDLDSEDEIDTFEDQAPKRRVPLEPICDYRSDPPLPDNSLRTDSATWEPGYPRQRRVHPRNMVQTAQNSRPSTSR
jgi:hypothetical protein